MWLSLIWFNKTYKSKMILKKLWPWASTPLFFSCAVGNKWVIKSNMGQNFFLNFFPTFRPIFGGSCYRKPTYYLFWPYHVHTCFIVDLWRNHIQICLLNPPPPVDLFKIAKWPNCHWSLKDLCSAIIMYTTVTRALQFIIHDFFCVCVSDYGSVGLFILFECT